MLRSSFKGKIENCEVIAYIQTNRKFTFNRLQKKSATGADF